MVVGAIASWPIASYLFAWPRLVYRTSQNQSDMTPSLVSACHISEVACVHCQHAKFYARSLNTCPGFRKISEILATTIAIVAIAIAIAIAVVVWVSIVDYASTTELPRLRFRN